MIDINHFKAVNDRFGHAVARQDPAGAGRARAASCCAMSTRWAAGAARSSSSSCPKRRSRKRCARPPSYAAMSPTRRSWKTAASPSVAAWRACEPATTPRSSAAARRRGSLCGQGSRAQSGRGWRRRADRSRVARAVVDLSGGSTRRPLPRRASTGQDDFRFPTASAWRDAQNRDRRTSRTARSPRCMPNAAHRRSRGHAVAATAPRARLPSAQRLTCDMPSR